MRCSEVSTTTIKMDSTTTRLLLVQQQLLMILKITLLLRKYYRSRKRRWWVRPIWRNRETEGEFHTVMKHLRNGDGDYFKKYYRMSSCRFDHLCAILQEDLRKKKRSREPLPPEFQVAVTLRYLASGMQIQDVALAFRIGVSTAATIIHKTCRIIWVKLQPIYMKTPTVDDYEAIAMNFSKRWQFPNCVGAIDGKHVQIQAPRKSGSLYYNYKGTFSIVLMASSDSLYKFVSIDVGAYGRQSDGGIFKLSALGQSLEKGTTPLPPMRLLPRSPTMLPHVFVGDEAFQLRPNFMRPYSGKHLDIRKKIFNYRLSRARRCVENAFGILAARWRIFRRPINTKPDNVDSIVKAACALHNYLCVEEAASHDPEKFYCPPGFADFEDSSGDIITGSWREELNQEPAQALLNLPSSSAHNFSKSSSTVRDLFADYFVSEAGKLMWQEEKI